MTWKLAGKLHRGRDFARNPVDTLHLRIRKLVPGVISISDVGVTAATNLFLRKKMEKAVLKQYPELGDRKLQSTVGVAMLNYSPTNLPEDGDYLDFHVYVRTER